jgi:hypothetical protein
MKILPLAFTAGLICLSSTYGEDQPTLHRSCSEVGVLSEKDFTTKASTYCILNDGPVECILHSFGGKSITCRNKSAKPLKIKKDIEFSHLANFHGTLTRKKIGDQLCYFYSGYGASENPTSHTCIPLAN